MHSLSLHHHWCKSYHEAGMHSLSLHHHWCKSYHEAGIVCIIDCTEIFIERPLNLLARAQTFSNYKKHNMVKLLIGITPIGCISFVSKAWGGRVSNSELTRSSGIFSKLCPGGVIKADRGFCLQEDLGLLQCELIVLVAPCWCPQKI